MATNELSYVDHMIKAAEILNTPDGPPKERLTEAGEEFWAALFDPNDWPTELLERANDIVERILSDGTIRATLKNMDSSTVEEVSRDIRNLAADLEAAQGKSRNRARIEEALARFREGFSASQAIVSTYGPQYGLDRDTALKIAHGFDWGYGRMAETCAAATGAFIVLGLKYGHTTPDDREAREKTYSSVRTLAEQFKARHGSLNCRDLLGCDVSTAEGCALAREKNLSAIECPKFVQTAAEILEELL